MAPAPAPDRANRAAPGYDPKLGLFRFVRSEKMWVRKNSLLSSLQPPSVLGQQRNVILNDPKNLKQKSTNPKTLFGKCHFCLTGVEITAWWRKVDFAQRLDHSFARRLREALQIEFEPISLASWPDFYFISNEEVKPMQWFRVHTTLLEKTESKKTYYRSWSCPFYFINCLNLALFTIRIST